jgi:hypothetical protein
MMPLKKLLDRALELESAPEEFDAESARKRSTEAREIRDRLPNFLRTGTAAQLAERITAPALIAIAKQWKWGDPNVLMCGTTRTGKSTAAAYLFRRLLGEAVRNGGAEWELAEWLRWFSAEDLSTCRKTHPLGHGDPPEILEACNARLLFLDDAGWDQDVIEVCSVIASRYERGWPTIITTGKTRDELTAHYGAAVVRRMREAGGKKATVIECFPPAVVK